MRSEQQPEQSAQRAISSAYHNLCRVNIQLPLRKEAQNASGLNVVIHTKLCLRHLFSVHREVAVSLALECDWEVSHCLDAYA
eukprot:COSAG02_NODE_1203_length_13900_cov_11.040287_12_plen_82_part_00